MALMAVVEVLEESYVVTVMVSTVEIVGFSLIFYCN